jgi:hypothetical protein
MVDFNIFLKKNIYIYIYNYESKKRVHKQKSNQNLCVEMSQEDDFNGHSVFEKQVIRTVRYRIFFLLLLFGSLCDFVLY